MTELTRRDFLAAGALAGAAAALPAAAVRAQQSPTAAGAPTKAQPGGRRTLRTAVMLGMVGEGKTVLEKFQICRDLGFDGIEVDSPTSIPSDEIAAAQEKTGLIAHGVVNSVHWQHHLNNPDPAVRAKGVEALRTCIKDAAKYRSLSILLVPAVVNGAMNYAAAWELSQAAIKDALPEAQAAGVKIAVENVWNNFLLSPLEAARYVDELGSPAAAWYFDIGNIINFGWPEQWIRTLGPRIAKIHLKDFSRKKRDDEGLWKGFSVQLGEGDANWPEVMKALDEIGYSTAPGGNWATAEVGGGDRNRLAQIKQQIDRVLSA